MDIVNIDKKDKEYLYSVVQEDEKLKNFFSEVGIIYYNFKKYRESQLEKMDFKIKEQEEKLREKIEPIVCSGVSVDFYQAKLENLTWANWGKYYLSYIDDNFIYFNDLRFCFEDIQYLIDFVKEHPNPMTEPMLVFPTEEKYLLELEDKKGIIKWEEDLTKRISKRKIIKGTRSAHEDNRNLNHCRLMLKELNEYEEIVGKLKGFKYTQLQLIAEYFSLAKELRTLEEEKSKYECDTQYDRLFWNNAFNEIRISNDEDKKKNFEYAELMLFKTLLKLHTYPSIKKHELQNKYQFNTDAVDEFLDYNKEKFNSSFALLFDEPTIDEGLKKILKKY